MTKIIIPLRNLYIYISNKKCVLTNDYAAGVVGFKLVLHGRLAYDRLLSGFLTIIFSF